jgi:hypothetical protein
MSRDQEAQDDETFEANTHVADDRRADHRPWTSNHRGRNLGHKRTHLRCAGLEARGTQRNPRLITELSKVAA